MDIRTEKISLREKYLKQRNSITQKEIIEKSEVIKDKILNTSYYKEAETIFIYLNIGSEVVTTDLIKTALKDGKKVCVPVSINNSRNMFFVNFNSFDSLVAGPLGTKIPIYKEEDIVESDFNTIIFVPGLVFDWEKYRVGYGGGYYDNFLSKNKYLKTVGLAFNSQILDLIPHGRYDICLDEVVTELS